MAEPEQQQTELDSLLNDINPKLLTEYNGQIAKEVRLSGSEEELRAFLYLKGGWTGNSRQPFKGYAILEGRSNSGMYILCCNKAD
ncbi:hypothetical protein [Cohnella thermotolerans]|uniref:hypothetical protein n=1 Tax=Cohnella thermotolerans TaxID=329858 RepID=UPI0012EC18D5|nr:hypothetical protein [Cohnella thermotolerans]